MTDHIWKECAGGYCSWKEGGDYFRGLIMKTKRGSDFEVVKISKYDESRSNYSQKHWYTTLLNTSKKDEALILEDVDLKLGDIVTITIAVRKVRRDGEMDQSGLDS